MVSCICRIRIGATEHHRSDSAVAQRLLRMTAHNDLLSPPVDLRGRGCDAESVLVWSEVGKPGPSGAKAVSLRSVQIDGTDFFVFVFV